MDLRALSLFGGGAILHVVEALDLKKLKKRTEIGWTLNVKQGTLNVKQGTLNVKR